MMFYTGRSKPPAGVKVDRRNPSSRGLKVYYPLNEGIGGSIASVADGARYQAILQGSTAGVPQWYANSEGPLLRWPAGGNWGWAQANDTLGVVSGRMFTYAVFFSYEQNVNFPVLLTECNAGNNTPQIQLYLEANSKLALFLRDDANHSVNPTAVGPTLVDGVQHMAALVGDGTTAYLYLDGVLLTSTSIATIGQTTTDQFIIGGARAGGNQHRGTISQVLAWDRPISAEEVQQLYRYPYSLLKVHNS